MTDGFDFEHGASDLPGLSYVGLVPGRAKLIGRDTIALDYNPDINTGAVHCRKILYGILIYYYRK